MISKSQLAIVLSRLKKNEKPKAKLEQYMTESGIAADILWLFYMKGMIKDKVVADFGAGNGIFGIGALLLEAKFCYFVEIDKTSLAILKENLSDFEFEGKFKIINSDVAGFENKVNLIVQNPPFGTKVAHADKAFLEVAVKCADDILSFHKSSTERFVRAFARDYSFDVSGIIPVNMVLSNTMKFHKSKRKPIDVSVFWLKRKDVNKDN